MRSVWLGALALQAVSAVLATPTPQTTEQVTSDGFDQLAAIAQSAFDTTKSEVDNGDIQKRGGTCAWHNVRVRREWCVSISHADFSSPSLLEPFDMKMRADVDLASGAR